jgi:hypothetical protein
MHLFPDHFLQLIDKKGLISQDHQNKELITARSSLARRISQDGVTGSSALVVG